MLPGELAIHLRLLHFQFGDTSVQTDDLFQHRLGFEGNVDRLAAGLITVERIAGLGQVAFDLRQLALQERQALRRFRRCALDVLLHIQRSDLIEDFHRLGGVGAGQGQTNNPRLLALLGNIQRILVTLDGHDSWIAHHLEAGARVRRQLSDLPLYTVFRERLASDTFDQQVVVFIEQLESMLFTGNQREFLALQFFRQIEPVDLQALTAPGVAVQAETRRRDTGLGLAAITSGEKTANDREGVGGDVDIKAQIIDRFADHRAGLDDADFGHRRRLPAEHAVEIGKPEHVVLLRFDLHQRVRQVHGRCQNRIGNAGRHEGTGERADQPFLVNQRAKYAEKINAVLIVVTGADY